LTLGWNDQQMDTVLASRYRVLQPLGQGGFGATYLAEDSQMPSQRRCVVKQLCPQVNDPECLPLIRDRFKREATILEDLGKSQPQIPDLYAFFSQDGQFYLVQEWINGVTLSTSVSQQGCWPAAQVQEFLIQILPTLAYIHGRGVIHRDIKPDNIILRTSDHKPVLIDFGAVRETMGTALDSANNSTNSIIIGTPGFMPQEQGVGRPVFSSDLFSLGLTAIFLLTGQPPTRLSHDPLSGEIIWRDRAPSLSSALAHVLEQAIRIHASDRFPTAQAMLEALQPQPYPLPTTRLGPLPPSRADHGSTLIAASNPDRATMPPSPQTSPGLTDWQKMLLTGGMVGAFTLGGMVLMRPLGQEVSSPDIHPAAIAESEPGDALQTQAEPPQSSPSPTPTPPMAVQPVPSAEPASSLEVPPAWTENEYTWLSQRPVTVADLQGKSPWQLDLMRNAIFARHGRLFNSPELQAYFDQQPWYQPLYQPDEFPSSLVSATEAQNAAFILEYQQRHGLRYIP
jgi:serine/threonine-protein kinase